MKPKVKLFHSKKSFSGNRLWGKLPTSQLLSKFTNSLYLFKSEINRWPIADFNPCKVIPTEEAGRLLYQQLHCHQSIWNPFVASFYCTCVCVCVCGCVCACGCGWMYNMKLPKCAGAATSVYFRSLPRTLVISSGDWVRNSFGCPCRLCWLGLCGRLLDLALSERADEQNVIEGGARPRIW